MHTTGRRRRRRHSAQFKAGAVGACGQPGVSLASVALSLGLNANLLRRWVVAAERDGIPAVSTAVRALPAPAAESFVPVTVTRASGSTDSIRIEVRRGATVMTMQWPVSAARQCTSLLRKLLR